MTQAAPSAHKALIRRPYAVLEHLSVSYPSLQGAFLRVTQPSASRVPRRALPIDLHVLGMPPAFILSQDQTLVNRQSLLTRADKPASARKSKLAYFSLALLGLSNSLCVNKLSPLRSSKLT